MKKFEGILLACDWDGTVAVNSIIPKENIDAIRYFQENGGMFTLCTGRNYLYFRQFEDQIMPNAPVVWYNGALITTGNDYKEIYKSFITKDAYRIVEYLIDSGIKCDWINFCNGTVDNEPACSGKDFYKLKDSLLKMDIYKILVITSDADEAEVAMQLLKDYDVGNYSVVRSFPNGIEILYKESTKATSIKRIAEICGAKKVVCVGDYENDIDMIQMADIGYAVANARDNVKAIADRVTKKEAKDGAIAEIIDDLGE